MKTQNPIIGRARGSAGGMTFAKVYDKNVARAKAFEVANPKTAAQTTQRNFFAELSALLTNFTDEQLRFLFPQKPKAMSRRNMLTKQLATFNVTEGAVKSIDFGAIDTFGNASTLDFGTVNVTRDEHNILVDLQDYERIPAELQDNQFVAAVINVTEGKIIMPITSTQVSRRELSITAPADWQAGSELAVIPFITNSVTTPSSFGTLLCAKRPVKKNA